MTIYIVKQGDTLSSIARAYGVSLARLWADNGLTSDALAVGQALIITLPALTHTVSPGETASSIAARYNLSLIELIQNNPSLALSDTLIPGQTLTISFQGEKKRSIAINGYAYPFIDRATLRRALPFLTYLSVFSYGFTTNGELVAPDDEELIAAAYANRAAPVLVLTSIGEDGVFSTERASQLFNDAALQETVLNQLIEVMLLKGYVGLDADFEFIQPEDDDAFFAFLENAAARLRPLGLSLSVALAPKSRADQPGLLYEAHDYAAVGAIADHVLLMTYEWGYTYGPPMAVAPINQVRSVIRYGVSEIPPEKIYMGVPNYGYDWTLPYERGVTRAASLGNEEAVRLAVRTGSEILFDETAASPYFYYTASGREHVVWFEDVRSIQAKMDLADEFSLTGLGYWNVMRPFAQNWAYISVNYRVIKPA